MWLYGLKLDMQSRKILKELGYKSMKDFEKSCDTDMDISEEDTERMYQDLVSRLKREGVWREGN
jgi:hypothetical protein